MALRSTEQGRRQCLDVVVAKGLAFSTVASPDAMIQHVLQPIEGDESFKAIPLKLEVYR